jgi:predicted ribosome quality control (RQC) complex YloA/Tae2 family protein
MHFDALTLACVTHELQAAVQGGRVQQVLLVDDQSVGLEVYAERQRRYLLLCAQPTASRVHLTPQKLRRGTDSQPPLLLLLRKYVRGSLLDAVLQPDPTERVLELRFDHPEHGTTLLITELIGRASNLLLLAPDGKIMECIRRVWPQDNVRRTLLPGQLYEEPAPQDKLSPLDAAHSEWDAKFHEIARSDGKLWRQLVDAFAGISPTLGRELAWRMAGDSDAPATALDPAAAGQVLADIWSPVQSGEWHPGLIWQNGALRGFAAYPVHFVGEFEPADSISAALSRYFDDREQSDEAPTPQPAADPYAARRGSVAALVRDARKRLQRQLKALSSDEPQPGEADALRTQAEWLLALSSQIDDEQEVLEVPLDDGALRIQRDPDRTPVEQAERMFDQAAKLERAAEFIPKRRAKLQADLEYLDQLEIDLSMAENHPEIVAVQEELREMGLLSARSSKTRPPKAESQPRRYVSPDGFAILVGRNARQNDAVTFDIANANDLWLHVRDAPGSHVVVRSGGQPLSDQTLEMAAQLAAYFSSLRGERAVPVASTTRRFVTRVAGGHPGQVHFRNADTITVPGELPEEAEPPSRS